MKRQLLPVLLLLFAFSSAATAQVETLWERTAPANHPDWFGENNTERGLAYGVVDGNARVFVASRSETPNRIRVLNAETGADVGALSSVGVEGGYLGTFILNDVAVSDDGIVFACNMELNPTASAPFKVYRWDDEGADPEVVITWSEDSSMRLGDRLKVYGSAADNSLEIYAGASNMNRVVRFTTSDQGHTFDSEIITLEGITTTEIFPNVALLGDGSGDFYFNAGAGAGGTGGVHPRLHRADGEHVATLTSVPVPTNTTVYFELGGRSYLAMNDGVTEDEMTFSLYDVTAGGGAARFVLQTPSLGNMTNIFGSGDLDIVVDEGDGTFVLYGLQTNNGIAAFRIDPTAVFEGTFYVGADGTAPGGTNPEYPSLAAAFADINALTPSGAITLLITSDLDERGDPLAIRSVPFSEDMPLTIRPAPGVTPTVQVSAATAGEVGTEGSRAGILIDNTSWVTLDGSNGSENGTSRDLTIVVDDPLATRGIHVIRDAQHVTIRNTRLLVADADAGVVGIRVRRDDDNTVVPGNLLIENNQIGSEDAPFFQALAFFGNETLEVQSTVVGNDVYASQRGITTFWVTGSTYADNRFYVLGTTPTTSWSAAIYLALGSDITITGNEVLGFTTNTATAQPNAGFLFNLNLGTVHVFNNMIAVPEFSNAGDAEDNRFHAFGVNNAGGTGDHHIYHNTVRIGGSDQTGRVAAFGFDVPSTLQSFTFRNNIFVNEVDAANSYIYHWPNATVDLLDSDYNNLFVTGASANVGRWNETDLETLTDWQFATGEDGNSVSTEVEFISDLNLRLTGASLGDSDLAGTPVAEVDDDIDGQPRHATPYMGAFEGPPFVSTDDPTALPGSFELHQNYPNPFRQSTTISYTLPTSGQVTIRVYNAAGQLVRRLVDDYQSAGRHEVRFDAEDLASGVYLYQMQFEDKAETVRMLLVR